MKAPRRTVTPGWAVGMRKLGTGVYLAAGGEIHVCTQELCDYFGVPYTRENAATVERAALDSIKATWPSAATAIVEHVS